MMNNRDARNFQKGYQEALVDIANAMSEGGENGVIEWLYNNARPNELEAIKSLMLRWDE